MVVEIEHSQGGTYRVPGNAVKLSDVTEETYTSPPLVGEHSDEIFTSLLGKSADELAELRSKGVI